MQGKVADGAEVDQLLLALQWNNLTGHALPTELLSLPELTELHLSHSLFLSGTIAVDALPARLRGLNMQGTPSVSGTLPTQLSDVSRLQYLTLADHKISGTYPTGLQPHHCPSPLWPKVTHSIQRPRTKHPCP